MIDLRQAGVDDAAELSRIQVDSWQAYESIFSPAYMAQHNTFERRFLYWMNEMCIRDRFHSADFCAGHVQYFDRRHLFQHPSLTCFLRRPSAGYDRKPSAGCC